jgi:hypothetical protein
MEKSRERSKYFPQATKAHQRQVSRPQVQRP